MIKLYTAIGRYVLRKNEDGVSYPVVITHRSENVLSVAEMIIWSSLLWRVSTYGELKQEYISKSQSAQISAQYELDHYLNRLQQRGLVASGKDYVGIDAVYNLFSRLYIIPMADSFLAKICAFVGMTFRGVPLRVTRNIFRQSRLSETEEKVLAIARQQMLSTAELIQCVQMNVSDVSTDDKLLAALYSDEDTNSDNIDIPSRFMEAQQPVLEAIANLYLKKQILLDKSL